tara:strand:- start:3665 stop:4267 length:603 start_codon:yes stop_codon:yes gene_type:complete
MNISRVAIDIDEVLTHFVKPMAKFHNVEMPEAKKYSYVYRHMFNVSHNESVRMVESFYDSEEFHMLQPIHGSQPILRLLRPRVDKMYVLTGRQNCVRDKTEEWINFHFPGIFDDVILTNSYTRFEVQKYDICNSLNIGMLIDDNDLNCAICKKWGMDVMHFAGHDGNVYPWCEKGDNSVLNWTELYNFFPRYKYVDIEEA